MKELAACTELSGGYILTISGYAMKQNAHMMTYMIITEYMVRGSLASVLKQKEKVSLHRKVLMARDIASGMRKIHEHGMIYRDIRPDNILVNGNCTAKISDMDISRVVDPLNRHTLVGCEPFMPPEFYTGTYGQKLDIFTFGLTLNELFTGVQHVFDQSARTKISFRKDSPIFPDLITRCTADNPKQRPAAIEIEKTLEFYCHAFDREISAKNLSYARLSIERKNEIFIHLYHKLHPPTTQFIRKKFPEEFRQGSAFMFNARPNPNASNEPVGDCHNQ